MSSLWRKRQINNEKEYEFESVYSEPSTLPTRLFDIFLLCAGFTLCVYSFGVLPGSGLGLLALFARGEL
jgi:hypothetical protein